MNGPPRLGLRENIARFVLLVAVNALVGDMYGQERTVLPLLAETEFGLTRYTGVLTFILAFGATRPSRSTPQGRCRTATGASRCWSSAG